MTTSAQISPFADDPAAREAVRRMRERSPEADPLARLPEVHPDRIPRHIAIIMDGNGRWAEERGFPRIFGHQNGAASVRTVMEECRLLGVEVITLYSFSLENWKRPAQEVEALMHLYERYLEGEREALADRNLRFRQIGRRDGLPQAVIDASVELERATANNTGPMLCLAVNYGSRAEIVDAAQSLARRVASGEIDPDQIDEASIDRSLGTAGLPDPDLLIRTAGEMRVSNFLLWQISYAELVVTDTLWPDFGVESLHDAIRAFAARDRRFGGLNG